MIVSMFHEVSSHPHAHTAMPGYNQRHDGLGPWPWQDGQQQGENQFNRDTGGTMTRGTGGQHLLDTEETRRTGTTVTVK